ncbi:hypothetical protein EML15_06935 [Corynebacterium sp. sy017]|nr:MULTISPECIES: hypothetical protein [unclassified Corynebacterium]MBP3088878.1 hypothetical protein [Corynebacterium sp. sy017]TSD91510.1 hypothetical protein ELY17_06945 [Corynebacterium sp. SY003]
MWHAVSFALADSLNVLLIGLIIIVAVIVPSDKPFGRIVSLLIAGDWLGVFLLSLMTMYVFDGLESGVKAVISSPVFGIILIGVGVLSAIMTWRGGDNSQLIAKLMPPLEKPTVKTFALGLVLGLVQSLTSIPFFAGIAVLSVGEFSTTIRYVGMFFYATLALSLPIVVAALATALRRSPQTPAKGALTWLDQNRRQAGAWAGYCVALVLILMGVAHL